VLYTTAWCGYCERLRQDLRASGILGPQVVNGYQVAKIEAALRAPGHTYLPLETNAPAPIRAPAKQR